VLMNEIVYLCSSGIVNCKTCEWSGRGQDREEADLLMVMKDI